MECQYCHNKFVSKTSLNNHQKTAKYCLEIQGVKSLKTFECHACGKIFSRSYHLQRHQKQCKSNDRLYELETKLAQTEKDIESYKKDIVQKDILIEEQKETIKELRKQIKNIATTSILNNKDKLYQEFRDKEEMALLKNTIKELREQLEKIQQDYKDISTQSILNDKDKIIKLTKKYVRKRPRKQFDARNVVYIITTPSLKKERRYILGKATNLTNRLSTYNKTDEHEVVFYKSCNTKEMMSCIENMVFNKLSNYREQANRERFVLPEYQDISFFSQKIEECISFFYPKKESIPSEEKSTEEGDGGD